MMIFIMILLVVVAILQIIIYKLSFREGYYRQKLLNRKVDISHVENMSLLDMLRS